MTIKYHSHSMGNGVNLDSMEWEDGDVFYLSDRHIVMRNWPIELNPTIEAMKVVVMKAQKELQGAEPNARVQYGLEWHMDNLVKTGFFDRPPAFELVQTSEGTDDPMRCLKIAMFLLGLDVS